MKLIDRLIFGFIAIALCALAVRSFMPVPVGAQKIWYDVVNVNLCKIGGEEVWKHDIIKGR